MQGTQRKGEQYLKTLSLPLQPEEEEGGVVATLVVKRDAPPPPTPQCTLRSHTHTNTHKPTRQITQRIN